MTREVRKLRRAMQLRVTSPTELAHVTRIHDRVGGRFHSSWALALQKQHLASTIKLQVETERAHEPERDSEASSAANSEGPDGAGSGGAYGRGRSGMSAAARSNSAWVLVWKGILIKSIPRYTRHTTRT